jgi:hypothetical protein
MAATVTEMRMAEATRKDLTSMDYGQGITIGPSAQCFSVRTCSGVAQFGTSYRGAPAKD